MRRELRLHRALSSLRHMDGWTVAGFEVTRTPFRGDFGADFVLTWRGVRIAVQAKRNRRPVGLRAVQEVVAAEAHYGCERAMVVTSGSFTEEALALARANGVRMRTRDDLARKLVELDENDARDAIEAARTMARARPVI